ncbi:FAD-dependent monooxygenase [Actinosynnema sp. NPDC047251]|uniref:Monooxygenase, FAD-binding protein n=1 Tax=Saccharothrix espanaensis (strain ATCC 51144 / DSM 44229 / JCM 9112 / NBRC 15066 / NRRL 15764) TaxID=1179773 RepID=K0JU77_SACES|nr:FAD-dependent monooxygenase [Saccharothrix espanaensis]CCH31385.1 Monooxygenase, FAD-binding protein [Saccharothrix espanaensis DSM 44229]
MDASVVVVGAGPTGLVLAGELRLAGVDVIVLEKLPAPTGESRGIGFTIRTAEVFDQRGLLPRFGEVETGEFGHFGGVPLDLGVLGTARRAAKTVPQATTEAVLERWAHGLGADIRRGVEVVGCTEDAAGVDVRAAGTDRPLRARYLVGCDGGRSTVRALAGFDFPGTDATTELLLADVRGVEVEPRMVGEQVPGGVVLAARLPDGTHRVVVGEHGAPPRRRSDPPDFAEVAEVWQRLTGTDIGHAEPVWVSAFGDAARLVTEYRRGRVLLAGDAAHVHLPAGGQGMNTGIQDAVNLGWKLGAVLRGAAPPSLVDTYHDERHAVGEALLADARAQGALILGGERVAPVRDVLAELLRYPEVEAHLAARVSGLDIRYDVGGGPNPLLGLRMPHLDLSRDGRRTGSTELLRTGRGVLLDLADNAVLRGRARPWADRIDIVTATPLAPVAGDTAAVLLRPDGHVAWAAPGSHHDLPMALDRWFGPAG